MNRYRAFSADDAVAAAAAALSRSAGKPVPISKPRKLSDDGRRNLILRASAVLADGPPRPIIIKATRAAGYDAGAMDAYERFGFVKEWAATTLVGRRAERRDSDTVILASDVSQGVLVFQDFGEELLSMVQPLLYGSASEAEQALTTYAIALAGLHAETIGCHAEHAAIVRSAFPKANIPPPGHGWIDYTRAVPILLGANLPDSEVALIAEHLQRPGGWLVLAHRDPCPDNVLMTTTGTAKLIDFEFAAPGHALLDAAYWKMGFPTCWCAGHVPKAIGERIDRAYRSVLAEAIPLAADDDAFRQESALISVAWLFGSLASMLDASLREDTSWGISTRRSRILYYLQTAIEIITEADVLPGIRKVAAAWLDDLRGRWPSISPLASYPAFTTLTN